MDWNGESDDEAVRNLGVETTSKWEVPRGTEGPIPTVHLHE